MAYNKTEPSISKQLSSTYAASTQYPQEDFTQQQQQQQTQPISQAHVTIQRPQSKLILKTEEAISVLPTLSTKRRSKSIHLKQIPIRRDLPSSIVKKDLNRLISQSPTHIVKKRKLKPPIPSFTNARRQLFLSDLKHTMQKHINKTKSERKEIKGELTRTIFSTLNANTAVASQFTKDYYVNYNLRNTNNNNTQLFNKDIRVSFHDQLYFNLKINRIQQGNQQKKLIRDKILRALISGAAHLKRLNMTMKDLMIYSSVPHDYAQLDFVKAVIAIKENRYDSLEKMVNDNRFLVSQVDDFNQTLLHGAAKRDRPDIMQLLLNKGSRVEAEDLAGRTPLHIAALFNRLDNIKILLYTLASPFKVTNKGEYAINLTSDPLVKFYLERARSLHKFNLGIDTARAITRIQFGLKFFFQTPIKEVKAMIGLKD